MDEATSPRMKLTGGTRCLVRYESYFAVETQ